MIFNFDTLDEIYDDKTMQCNLYLYNGERKLEEILNKPLHLQSETTNSTKFDCVNSNSVIVPKILDFQILTFEFKIKLNDREFSYCSDLFTLNDGKNQKFVSQSSAQEYLDQLLNYEGNRSETALWVFCLIFGIIILISIIWCFAFCCPRRVIVIDCR